MSVPVVVTHPSPLLHHGLRQLFAKSSFRPLRVATTLTPTLESYLISLQSAVWLTGIGQSPADTNFLLRKIISANPRIKAVVMAGSQEPEDIVTALKSGACGYVHPHIAGETLLRSLELIVHGEMTVHSQLAVSEKADADLDQTPFVRTIDCPTRPLDLKLGGSNENESTEIPSLSRREMLILRMLMEGASNKSIALKLVITESTVKVHMKSVLRKLRLRNRTQAAIWARDHVGEAAYAEPSTNGFAVVHQRAH
jgi:DNA-binding NarL/FixJ family response regulator